MYMYITVCIINTFLHVCTVRFHVHDFTYVYMCSTVPHTSRNSVFIFINFIHYFSNIIGKV